jgi:hypothetical protein
MMILSKPADLQYPEVGCRISVEYLLFKATAVQLGILQFWKFT